ncbi:polysaccharide biosynthesis protein, partial [Streptomyces sp. SID14478]|nr:polysaccharide biosynthesis protein [Streptomyces sp. SID14478]
TWTAEQLAGIAGACADGRHEVVGIVIAGTVRGVAAPSPAHPGDHAAEALAVRGGAKGGSA